MKKKTKIISKYLFTFMLAAFIGWLYEIVTINIMYHQYYDRGVLHLPMCPIYGFGVLFLDAVLHKVKNGFLYFLGSFLTATALELGASYILEYGFGMVLWSYSDWPLNFQSRISLISSCIFGLMAVFYAKLLKPGIEKLFEKLPLKITAGTTFFIALFCTVWELVCIFR